jgi:hypothetical protein
MKYHAPESSCIMVVWHHVGTKPLTTIAEPADSASATLSKPSETSNYFVHGAKLVPSFGESWKRPAEGISQRGWQGGQPVSRDMIWSHAVDMMKKMRRGLKFLCIQKGSAPFKKPEVSAFCG